MRRNILRKWCPLKTRLTAERLEARDCPATTTWTGLTVYSKQAPDVTNFDPITCAGTGQGMFSSVFLDAAFQNWTCEPDWPNKRYRPHN